MTDREKIRKYGGAMGQYTDAPPKRFGRSSGVSSLRRHLNELAASDPEAIKREVIAQGKDPFVVGLVETLKETSRYCYSCHRGGREKWAFRLYAELAEMVGSGPEINVAVFNAVGAPAPQARQMVERGKEAEALAENPQALANRLCRWIEGYAKDRGLTVAQVFELVSGAEEEAQEGPYEPRAGQNGAGHVSDSKNGNGRP